ncbi:hypothetical protein [Haloplanus salilacus]
MHAVRDALPDARLVEIEGVGHSGPTEAPARVADEVRAFVEAATLRIP